MLLKIMSKPSIEFYAESLRFRSQQSSESPENCRQSEQAVLGQIRQLHFPACISGTIITIFKALSNQLYGSQYV